MAVALACFVGSLLLLRNQFPLQPLDGHCDGGLCLFDPGFWLVNLKKLLTALVLLFVAAGAVVSFFTLALLTRLKPNKGS